MKAHGASDEHARESSKEMSFKEILKNPVALAVGVGVVVAPPVLSASTMAWTPAAIVAEMSGLGVGEASAF